MPRGGVGSEKRLLMCMYANVARMFGRTSCAAARTLSGDAEDFDSLANNIWPTFALCSPAIKYIFDIYFKCIYNKCHYCMRGCVELLRILIEHEPLHDAQ